MQHVHSLALTQDTARRSDRELLERFLADHDETAFEALVRRHGPMVLNVCRRVLRDPHDAEDAFQATFLVFVQGRGDRTPGVTGQLAVWRGLPYGPGVLGRRQEAPGKGGERRA